MFSLTALTTHRRQPLDVSSLKPLSTYVKQASYKWMCSNSHFSIPQFKSGEILCEAYGKFATFGNAIAGFAKTVTRRLIGMQTNSRLRFCSRSE